MFHLNGLEWYGTVQYGTIRYGTISLPGTLFRIKIIWTSISTNTGTVPGTSAGTGSDCFVLRYYRLLPLYRYNSINWTIPVHVHLPVSVIVLLCQLDPKKITSALCLDNGSPIKAGTGNRSKWWVFEFFLCTFESFLIANVPFFPILNIYLINHFIEFVASMCPKTTMAHSKKRFGSSNWSMVSF